MCFHLKCFFTWKVMLTFFKDVINFKSWIIYYKKHIYVHIHFSYATTKMLVSTWLGLSVSVPSALQHSELECPNTEVQIIPKSFYDRAFKNVVDWGLSGAQAPCWAGPALHCPKESWPYRSWDTEARELAPPLTGELATVLKRNGPTPYGRRGRSDPDGMRIGELTLSLSLRPQCPWNDHFSSHSPAQSSLGWAALTSTPSKTFWSSGRNWSSGTIPAGSPRLGAAMGYSRGVRVRVQWWWCVPESEALIQTNDTLQWAFASTADGTKCTVWHTEAPRVTRRNEEVWGREKTWRGRVFFSFSFVQFCFCLSFLLWGTAGMMGGYEEAGRWV